MKNFNAFVTLISAVIMFFCSGILTAQPWMTSKYLDKPAETANFLDIQKAFYNYWDNRPYERGKGFNQFKRWEWRMEPKCFPDGTMPVPMQYWNEYQKFIASCNYQNTKTTLWMPLGIESWINGNSGYNPGNGRLNAVTVDMGNRDVIYVAAPSGGIWKSVDGGFTWNTTFDYMPVLGTSAIAIHPVDHNIVFCGTGDRDAWNTPGVGIYKSTDAGATWQTTGMSFIPQGKNVNKILINPLNPNSMFAATSSGIYRSRNGGANWASVYYGSGVNDLKFRPGDTSILYGSGNYFVRSANAGSSFTKITATLPHDTSRLEFDVTADNPDVVYVVASRPANWLEGIYKSVDSGQTFTAQCHTPNILGYSDVGADSSGQAWYDLALAVSPSNDNEVWVGGINMWKSTDGGVTWQVNTEWYTGNPYNYIHCDIHSVNFYGDSLYVGSDGGIFMTPDHGDSWLDLSVGLSISQFYRMGGSENNPLRIAAGAQDIGSNLLDNGVWTHVFGADGMEALISSINDNIIFVSFQMGGILRSINGGYSFQGARPVDTISGGWVTPYIQHKDYPLTFYAGYQEVFRSDDGTYTWYPISSNLTGGGNIEQLVAAPNDPDVVYASRHEKLYFTQNNGATWNNSTPNSGMYITGIAVHPANFNRIWVTTTSSSDDRVYYSSDGGVSFTNVTGNLTHLGFNCIVYQTGSNDGIYIGTETGVVYKNDTMSAWIPWDTDLPHVPVSELEINYASGSLRAATYGRGIWTGPLYNTVGIKDNGKFENVNIFPNPASRELFISGLGSLGDKAELRLFNITGALVRNMLPDIKPGVTVSMDVSNLVAGTYYLKIISGKETLVKKISLLGN